MYCNISYSQKLYKLDNLCTRKDFIFYFTTVLWQQLRPTYPMQIVYGSPWKCLPWFRQTLKISQAKCPFAYIHEKTRKKISIFKKGEAATYLCYLRNHELNGFRGRPAPKPFKTSYMWAQYSSSIGKTCCLHNIVAQSHKFNKRHKFNKLQASINMGSSLRARLWYFMQKLNCWLKANPELFI